MSILKLALRKLTEHPPQKDKVADNGNADLEQAMADFQNATTPGERAAAFKAALELAKTE